MRNHSRTTSTKVAEFRRIEVITGVGRRRRWTDEEKAWIVAESLDPTTTISAVARRYGLHASQLFVWRQRLAAPAAREAPAFVPVVVADGAATPAEAAGRMEIALGPVVVRVGAALELDVLGAMGDADPERERLRRRGRERGSIDLAMDEMTIGLGS